MEKVWGYDFGDGSWIRVVKKRYQPLDKVVPMIELKPVDRAPITILLYDMNKEKELIESLLAGLIDYAENSTEKAEEVLPATLSQKDVVVNDVPKIRKCKTCGNNFEWTSPNQKNCDDCRRQK